ncbi:MAG TPA: thiamine pyrophosphate-binding protein, partial [Kofleriaceae bacterium]|nr:thiamine pyrophosphate-binding protein [Kofleriaceae bacterium]
MNVAEAVARSLAAHGVDHVFGVVGSGNFHVTNALIAAGARYIAAVHEGGAASMADAYARVSGRLCALSVHQGPGVTNALTGVVEAAKSRTPLIVLAPEATSPRSNFFLDLPGLAVAIGAGFRRVTAARAASDVADACRAAVAGAGQTVVLGLPLDVQAMPAGDAADLAQLADLAQRAQITDAADLAQLADLAQRAQITGVAALAAREELGPLPELGPLLAALAAARRPVFIAGRGATRRPAEARAQLTAL